MSVWASRSLLTETLVVVFTQGKFGVFLDMNIKTFVSILTIAILVEELTLAHLSKIVFVEVVACIALFAEALEPMFADIIVIISAVVMLGLLCWGWMTIRTTSTSRALAVGSIIGAYRNSRGEGGESVCA